MRLKSHVYISSYPSTSEARNLEQSPGEPKKQWNERRQSENVVYENFDG